MDNVPVVTDGGYFYDSGGPTSNYGSNEKIIIKPSILRHLVIRFVLKVLVIVL